jgi:DNA-directed RNA polymerase subunit H (RpoH/RPB5)
VANRGRSPANRWVLLAAGLGIAAVAIGLLSNRPNRPKLGPSKPATPATSARSGSSDPSVQSSNPAAPTELPRIEVKQAVMVTVELDFGAVIPSIADALLQIERRHQPEDGVGRVFAILDAYGGPTTDGRKLHMSMHVSTEKTGIGSLVYRRTGEVLWSNRIIPAADGSRSASSSGLVVLLDDGSGRVSTVDGSTNPESIVQAGLKESGVPVEQFWPDGVEREVTFIYSACGCPVKVMAKREGDRVVRTKELPVIFPDDPAVVELIARLMRW